ncbi:MAG TPA: 1-deoxy-D-xylulose-5-phosphate synthase [Prolixibacteraceae bacterium]|nr:1-deoxy-D-xylulose-5-phosphate synthase [Prolixibacteraceae bacterium]
MVESGKSLLDQINDPSELRKLKVEQLPEVCTELRDFIIDAVSTNPGHFGASLGVVELTVALHYVFNTPYDLLVWDVGHQAYGHKILTGRKDVFHTNRKYKGISGFPKPSESVYDSFGVGHASTSISAALGMAVASRLKEEKDRKIVAIIGDGAMTGGMAFEGLNNASVNKSDLLVILNDNNMAIDPSVGGMSDYLLKISKSQTYNRLKKDVWEVLGKLNGFGPKARRLVQKTENAIKTMLLKQSNLFEGLGFRYFGPVDGHNVIYLTEVLQSLSHIPGPKLLHVSTKKGKGFKLAELNQTEYHAPGKFDKVTGEMLDCECVVNKPPKFQNVFGHTLIELAEMNDRIVGITPAMPSGCSLNLMMEKMPHRTFDVGIAEQHAVTFSAGLAIQGMLPYCNIYSTFMQRAYDQVIHDVALQNLQVVFCLDRGGLVGADGATHHGVFDLAYMRSIPNMIVSAPMDELELRHMMFTAQNENHGPFSIRYPRGCGSLIDWRQPMEAIPIGKSRQLADGSDLAILTIGTVGIQASRVIKMLRKDGINAAHYDMRFVKPLDEEALHIIFSNYKRVMTIEDGVLQGGFGSAVLEFMSDHQYSSELKRIGIPDQFVDHGTTDELHREVGLDQQGIYQTVKSFMLKD